MTKGYLLSELPDHVYPLNLACPECYAPLLSRNRRDGRCDSCLRDKKLLPVNWIRPHKRRDEEDEEREDRSRRRYEDE